MTKPFVVGVDIGGTKIAAARVDAGAGVIAERPVTVPPSLAGAAEALVALLNRWEPARAEALFSFNVDLDEPLSRRRQQAADRLAAHGPLTVRSITALNGAEGDVEVVDGRGHPLTLAFMVSGEAGGGRVQWYELDETPPPAHDVTAP